MKITEVRAMSDAELGAKLRELKEELFNLRFQLAVNQLENTNRIVEVKRDIARVIVHKYKDSREQFELRYHNRLIDIKNPTKSLAQDLMNLELPAGVDISADL